MFWEIGKYINSVILDFKRAPYGKKIFSTLSRKLATQYGKSFQEENLYSKIFFYGYNITFNYVIIDKD
jgi:hypothetical protein